VSQDEFFVLMISGFAVVWAAWGWYSRIVNSAAVVRIRPSYLWLEFVPAFALVIVFAVVKFAGSFDVRNDPEYVLLYSVLGGAWMFAAAYLMSQLGISFRDDAIERRNPAAAIMVGSALVANALIYAGANIGDGPGWWVVIAAGLIGSGAWFLLWSALEYLIAASERITVDRDVSVALRLGGYMLAMGLICARGSAGDWTSLEQTLREFGVAWPILPLTAIVIGLEWIFQSIPRSGRPGVFWSALIAVAYLAGGILVVDDSGPLPDNPQYDSKS
jgi:hypothetical protein